MGHISSGFSMTEFAYPRFLSSPVFPGPRIHSMSIHGFPNTRRISTLISIIFGCQSSIIHTRVDIYIDIQAGISMQGHSAMDSRKVDNKYPLLDIHVFMISLFILTCFYRYPFGCLWISMDIHALTCYRFSIQGSVFLYTTAIDSNLF